MEDYKIESIYRRLGLTEDEIAPYGLDKCKITPKRQREKKAKLILSTAMTPTKAGEGKTTTAISLADGLCLLGKNALACLREPSLGPVFGVKGGGAGGGECTLYPEDDINLHFTGDIHAITSLNNLIAALVDNEIYQKTMDIDKDRVVFPRCLDMNDRALRDVRVFSSSSISHSSSFVITAASEVMAVFCLAKDEEDFLNRIENITVAYSSSGTPICVRDLHARNAFRKLIHTALKPNLVQTKYHTPAIVHGGPFANIAHGTNSVIATDLSLRLADYVVTEAGFGSDLGMEKYLDIIAPLTGKCPDLILMVCSIRALKSHGGVKFDDLERENLDALKVGYQNLYQHVENVKKYHLPCLVVINRFPTDTDKEIDCLEELLSNSHFDFAYNSGYQDGPKGALEFAKKVVNILDTSDTKEFKPIVSSHMTLRDKINTIAKEIYRAKEVIYLNGTEERISQLEKSDCSKYSICMSKVPTSFSDDPKLINTPEFSLHIRDVKLYTGASFVVPLTGDVFTMPGLPKEPLAKKM